MKFPKVYPLKEIAQIINCNFVGDADFPVHGMNEIHVVEPGDIVFVDHPKYYDKALQSAATIVLINKEVECPEGKALLISDDPFRDFNKLTKHFRPFQASNAAISDSAIIGEETVIQPNCFIGHNVQIGKKCLIASQTGIAGCVIIEDEVTLWGQVGTTSGITIGAKAVVLGQTGVTKSIEGGKSYFGTPVEESREKLKQLANVKRIPDILNKIK